jgi:predicted CXXCH cytochrome family protein
MLLWAAVLGAAAGCGAPGSPSTTELEPAGAVVASNIRFEDYAGSETCTPCHREIAEQFARSPMHRMTRNAASIVAPPTGTLRLGDDVVTMHQVGERRFVVLESARLGTQTYRLTEVIGGRYREDYVGIRVSSVTNDRPIVEPATKVVLPVSWIIETEEWRYKGYSVQVSERPGMVAGPKWETTCLFCHNTVPYLATMYDELADFDVTYQGSVPSNLLPSHRRLEYTVDNDAGLGAELRAEIDRLGEEPPPASAELDTVLSRVVYATADRFRRDHLVELGIGCESCHGGTREHVETPSRLPSYQPVSPLVSVSARGEALSRAEAINHGCARCHSVLFSRYPHTWEGGRRRRNPGGSTINSGEARDFLLGGCAEEMACTACHDPHAADDRAHLDRLATPAGNTVCTGCHTTLATDAALRAHSHHDPAQAGSSCIGCHMPRKNVGLDYGLTRYHRIGSPNDRERVERDRPLECALCHLDRSVTELATTMEQWWGRPIDDRALVSLYGDDLSVPVLEATLARGLPHEQTVAIERLGYTGDRRHLPAVVDQLDHELPLTRYFARAALERLTGERAPLDMSRPGIELELAGRRWLEDRSPPSPSVTRSDAAGSEAR